MALWFMVTWLSKDNMVALALDLTVWLFSGTELFWPLVVGNFRPCPLYPTICPDTTASPGPAASSQLRTKAVWKGFFAVSMEITWAFTLWTAPVQENVCVLPECEARFMVFKIHELHGMERSFSKYKEETERLCLHDTQALGHLWKKSSQTIYWKWCRFFPHPLKKKGGGLWF